MKRLLTLVLMFTLLCQPIFAAEKNYFHITDLTTTDTRTGLMWVRNGNLAGRPMSYGEAMDYVKQLDYAGYNDWRLPTKDELMLLAKSSKQNPKDFGKWGFKNVALNKFYWTSSVISSGASGMQISTVNLNIPFVGIGVYIPPPVNANLRNLGIPELINTDPNYFLVVRSRE